MDQRNTLANRSLEVFACDVIDAPRNVKSFGDDIRPASLFLGSSAPRVGGMPTFIVSFEAIRRYCACAQEALPEGVEFW